jgi:amidase
VAEQRDVTGAYIWQFLSAREIEITETDAVGIAKKTTTAAWSAVEVVEAFAHRASLAHELVSGGCVTWHRIDGNAPTTPLTGALTGQLPS